MQSLLHDAQNFVILPAFDPDDAERIEAEAEEAGRIAIGTVRSPQRISFPLSQNPGCHRCGESCHGGRKFSLQPIRSELVKRAKLQAAVREGGVQTAILKRQNLIARARLQVMPLKGSDLHP